MCSLLLRVSVKRLALNTASEVSNDNDNDRQLGFTTVADLPNYN